jgi:hypothetical protein
MSRNRSSGYVMDNDVRYGLKGAHRDPKSSEVTNLQCSNCIALVGRRRLGRSARLQLLLKDGVIHPFRYDNIEHHLCNQHSGQWALYQALECSFEHASFFDDVAVVFQNSCKSHVGKTNSVHKEIPALINANQSFFA